MDRMQDLLLNHDLSKSKPGRQIAQIAREQTLITLRRLDANRNGIVLRFLQETHLIQDGVVNLSYADLSGDELSGAHLSGATLYGTDLSGADLSGADLSGATLYAADLSGADLSRANLSNAQLIDASLTRANLNDAHLSMATLTSAFLGNASLNGATLAGAHLDGATLKSAQLKGSNLSDASLNDVNLSGADLRGADFSDADLSGDGPPNLQQLQLNEVASCTKAILSTGLVCRHKPQITLAYWYTESSAEAGIISKLIHQFEQKHPYIKIKPVNMPFFQTQAAYIGAVQSGKAPDVLRSDVGWVTQFASQGYLLSIDPYISQNDLSDYRKAPLGSVPLGYDKYNGHLYGLPQVTDFLALLYNKTDISRAPATMYNFEHDAMQVMQSKAIGSRRQATYGFEAGGGPSTSYDALPFLFAFGGGMLDQHNTPLVNNQGSVAGLNFLLKLQNHDKVMPPVSLQYGPRIESEMSNNSNSMVSDFMSGKTAMIFDGPWDMREILTASGSVFKGNQSKLGIASVPTCPADTPTCPAGHTGSPLGGQSYVISAGTAHPAEAYNFISFMSSTTSQVQIAKANHTLPTRQSAYQDWASSDQVISEFLRIKNTAIPRPVIPQSGHLFDALNPNIGAALDGTESPVDALNTVAEAWNQLLAGS